MCTEGQFKEKMNNLFGHITGDPKTDVTDDDIRSLLFGDYLNKGKDERLYDEIQNLDELREVSPLYNDRFSHLSCLETTLTRAKMRDSMMRYRI